MPNAHTLSAFSAKRTASSRRPRCALASHDRLYFTRCGGSVSVSRARQRKTAGTRHNAPRRRPETRGVSMFPHQQATETQAEDRLVYVVDDDAAVREAMDSLIRSAGFNVRTFESARDFLESCHSGGPACLVLDVGLPGLNGLDLQRELVRAEFHIPIIFVTGQADVPMSVRAMKAGAVEFLTKPFRGEDLLSASG